MAEWENSVKLSAKLQYLKQFWHSLIQNSHPYNAHKPDTKPEQRIAIHFLPLQLDTNWSLCMCLCKRNRQIQQQKNEKRALAKDSTKSAERRAQER